jgi:dTDP-glucose pyrophosphorylase
MQILIPMAGSGQRFKDAGYKEIKPLINVINKPMIQAVIENLGKENSFIFVLNKEHDSNNLITNFIKKHCAQAIIKYVDKLTDGPACTALLAQYEIDESDLIIVNCDQIIRDFNLTSLLEFARINNADGVLGTFISSSKKNSYVKLDPNGEVTEVREKIVISNIATNGLHYWRNGKDFIKSAKEMIKANERYNNEFYIAPTYNHLIQDGKKILPFFYNLHIPIGTPEDLKIYEKIYENLQF